jgi:anaerobic ribonucleoside-triphosphate reductase activating protein
MNILATQYTLQTQSFEIYLSGCNGNPKCSECYSQESWDFSIGNRYTTKYLFDINKKIKRFDKLIKNIFILGGEPLDQNIDEFYSFVKDLIPLNKNLWLFTRYNFNEIPDFLFILFDYIKCGKYNNNLKTDNNIQYSIKLATSNQKIYKKGIDF